MLENANTRQRINYGKIITYSAELIVIGLLVWYLYQNRSLFVTLRNVRWQDLLWIILFDTSSFIVSSFINYSMIQRFDSRVTFLDCVMLQYVNNLLNKILPTIGGGAAFRAYYLKKAYQFPYSQFASTVAGLYIISFSTTSAIGILCLLVIYGQFHVFNWVIFLAFLGILVPTLFVILFSPKLSKSDRRWMRILKNTIDSWYVLKKEPKLVFAYMALSVLLLLLSTAYSYVGYHALGVNTSFIPMLYLSTLGIIMAFLNFTPDGIGVKEGIYLFSKELVQIPQGLLVFGSLYLRGVSVITTFLFGGISYWVLMRRLKSIHVDQVEIPATDNN